MQFFEQNKKTTAANLDVRVKTVFAICMSMFTIIVDSIPALTAAAAAGALFLISVKPNKLQWKFTLFTTFALVWGLMISQGIFYRSYPRNVLFRITSANLIFPEGLALYREGIRHGLLQSCRLLAASFTGFAICFSTAPSQFLSGMRSMKVPYSLAFMTVSAVRFIPIAIQEFFTVRTALRIKGYRPFKAGLRKTVAVEISVLRPVIGATIRRSEETAMSILARGFNFHTERTSCFDKPLHPCERIAIAIIIAATTATAAVKVVFLLYIHEFYYSETLRPLYAFVREWL